MKIYLSGPMKGYPQNNYPLFNAVALLLRNGGNEVYNPAEYNVQPFNLRKAFAEYSKFICEEADAILILPGWENSVGANAEKALAENCGIEIFYFHQCIFDVSTLFNKTVTYPPYVTVQTPLSTEPVTLSKENLDDEIPY